MNYRGAVNRKLRAWVSDAVSPFRLQATRFMTRLFRVLMGITNQTFHFWELHSKHCNAEPETRSTYLLIIERRSL
jgi:hypothetical protein